MLTNKVNVLPDWPSQSPDLNLIEHLWSKLGRWIRKQPQAIKNITELLQEEWDKSNNQLDRKYVTKNIETVIKSNGWPTKLTYIVNALVEV